MTRELPTLRLWLPAAGEPPTGAPSAAGARAATRLGAWRLLQIDPEFVLPARTVGISLITPVTSVNVEQLRSLGKSVSGQTHPTWRWLVIGIGLGPEDRQKLAAFGHHQPRTTVVTDPVSGGSEALWTLVRSQAASELVAFADATDCLMPHALSRVSLLFGSVPELDVLYADEFTYVGEFAYDHACVPNAPAGYLPKPAWSPLLAQRVPYLGHFVAFRRQILDLPKSHDSVGTAGLDALIRAASSSRGIGHLTEPLSARPVDSPQVIRSVRREEAPVVTGRQPQRADRTISVVVPTKDHAADLERCLRSVRSGTQGLPVEVIVVDHESTEPATARVIADFADKVIRQEGDFNFSRLVNAGVARADGQLVVLLNNDTEGLSEAWLDQLASPFASSRVGAVGALLLEVDDCIQHTGIAVGGSGLTTHPYRGAPRELDDPPGLARDIREVTAATGACLAVRRDVYLDLGGMDEEYLVHYQDVDLCLRIWDARLSVVVNPACVLRHKESSSLHQADWTTISAHSRRDRTRFRERWASLVAHDDLFLRGAGAG